MRKLSLALAGILIVLVGFLVFRTSRFASRQLRIAPVPPVALEGQSLAGRLGEALRFKTVSFQDPRERPAGEFRRFHAFLAKSYPDVHRRLSKETVSDLSLLFTWPGKDPGLKPMLLTGHMDVVPVDPATEKNWTHPPFSGALADGYIWGRGAMDDKVGVLALLEAVRYLLGTGFEPRRTIFLAFGHDEEMGGADGAGKIADLLRSRGIALEFVLDEGMNVVEGIIPGIAEPVALVGIAEKGYLSLELSIQSQGGHSSIPPADTAIGRLSRALQKLDASPFPARLYGPTKQMLEFLGPEMTWTRRLVLANLWLFEPLVVRQLTASPLTNASIRTTMAPTIFSAGIQENILPTRARAVVNLRLLPGETIAGAIEYVREAVDDPGIKISALPTRMEPSAVSDIEAPSFQMLQRTIRQTIPQALVAPSLLVAATDSRHYALLTKNIYRFLPITLRPGDAKRYHGINERISIEDYERCVRFYVELIRNGQA